MTGLHGERLTAAARAADTAGVDALIVTPGADLRYLLDYHAIALERLTCLVLPRAGEPFLVVPRLELAAAQASGAADLVRVVSHDETADAYRFAAGLLIDALGRTPASLGVSDRMWAEQVLHWRDVLPGSELTLAGTVLRPLRLRKSDAEVSELRRAAQAIDRVHAGMGEWLRPGRSEVAVARDIADAILLAGHETVNFVIVGSGPNGASPHHDVSERVIEAGDPVVVDIGGTTPAGYCSDCTRTYVAGGEPPGDFVDYYAVLLAAQQAACRAVRPGVTAEGVDAAAREVIDDAGYGELFIHRTGHGIGMEEHEEPWIVAGNPTALEPGMCFSIEPGIYAPGRHGARIEDIVVVTGDGVERLDTLDRDLVRLG